MGQHLLCVEDGSWDQGPNSANLSFLVDIERGRLDAQAWRDKGKAEKAQAERDNEPASTSQDPANPAGKPKPKRARKAKQAKQKNTQPTAQPAPLEERVPSPVCLCIHALAPNLSQIK